MLTKSKDVIIINEQVYEDFYYLSFFNLSQLASEECANVIQCFRDLALLKALYWRMFSYFRWIINDTTHKVPQSPVYSLLR